MKKLTLLSLVFILLFSVTAFAARPTITIDKAPDMGESFILVNVNADSKIRVTGFTPEGNNIFVDYVYDSKGSTKGSVPVDLRTIAKPYRIILRQEGQKLDYVPFPDIKSHPMKDYIRHLYDMGYVDGYEEDNTFKPDNNIKRGEFMKLMVEMRKLQDQNRKPKDFSDLNSKHWAYGYALRAVDSGLIEGYDEGGKKLIKLDNNVTIAEVITIIDRAFAINNTSLMNYDTRFFSHWARQNVQSLVNENIILPTDAFYKEGKLDRPATRSEAVMLLSRAVGR